MRDDELQDRLAALRIATLMHTVFGLLFCVLAVVLNDFRYFVIAWGFQWLVLSITSYQRSKMDLEQATLRDEIEQALRDVQRYMKDIEETEEDSNPFFDESEMN